MLDTRIYGHQEWAKHKSSYRHGRHLFSFLSSGIIFTLAPPVCACTLLATCVTLYNHSWVELGNGVALEVSVVPLVLTSAVLSLLLVFRTNSSYNRYDEARKMWAGNVNRGRDLARQGLTWIRSPKDSSKLTCMLRHVKAYSFCLQDHLTEQTVLESSLQPIMSPQELAALMSAPHRPSQVLQILSKLLNKCELTEFQKMTMDDNLTAFHDNLGACERIFKTPIPIAYTLVTSRFLILWHLVLPFALAKECGWLTIPAAFLTATALFYIEAVGVLIEEPFWILPLRAMAEGVVADVDELVKSHEAAENLLWSKESVVQITVGKDPDIGHITLRKMNTIA